MMQNRSTSRRRLHMKKPDDDSAQPERSAPPPGRMMTPKRTAGPTPVPRRPVSRAQQTAGQNTVSTIPTQHRLLRNKRSSLVTRVLGDWDSAYRSGTKRSSIIVEHENDPDNSILVWKRVTDTDAAPNALQLFSLTTIDDPNLVKESIQNKDALFFASDPVDNLTTQELTKLKHMNPVNILGTLRQRFFVGSQGDSFDAGKHYYSSVGNVLMAINPYRDIDSLYSDIRRPEFIDRPLSSCPHPYNVADLVIRHAAMERTDQSIVISGESGAGKTETSKHLLRYFTNICHDGSTIVSDLSTRIMACNPILELFGNAKTHRNNNSSRFGRMMSLVYRNSDSKTERMKLSQCTIDTSLLAKSRVTKTPRGEQNYHVLYCILDEELESVLGADMMTKCGLMGLSKTEMVAKFRLVADPLDNNYNAIYTPFKLAELLDSLEKIGLCESDVRQIIRVLLSILYLGNLQFATDDNGDAFLPPQQQATMQHIEYLLALSGSGPISLVDLLSKQRVRAGHETFTKRLDVNEVNRGINSVITNLYARLIFDVVIAMVNRSLFSSDTEDIVHGDSNQLTIIRLLDLYGFEDMEPDGINGFEQLNINFANERFQRSFMKQMVDDERVLYQSEGILTCFDPTLALASHNPNSVVTAFRMPRFGIYATLDQTTEEAQTIGTKQSSAVQRNAKKNGYNSKFCRSVNDATYRRNTDALIEVKFAFKDDAFVVKHFAGDVTYSSCDFVESNQDTNLKPVIAKYLREHCFHDLLPSKALYEMQSKLDEAVNDRTMVKSSNAKMFQVQLDALSSTIESTHCWFVRCIKPNSSASPILFDDKFVLRQLINGGIVEMLKLMKKGHPYRIEYKTLWDKFSKHIPKDLADQFTDRDFAMAMARHFKIPSTDLALGRTLLFMKLSAWEFFDKIKFMTDEEIEHLTRAFLRVRQERAVETISSSWRRYQARKAMLWLGGSIQRTIIPMLLMSRRMEAILLHVKNNHEHWVIEKLYSHAARCVHQEAEQRQLVEEQVLRSRFEEMAMDEDAHRFQQEREYELQERRCLEEQLMREEEERQLYEQMWEENACLEEEQTIIEREAIRRKLERDKEQAHVYKSNVPLPMDFSPAFQTYQGLTIPTSPIQRPDVDTQLATSIHRSMHDHFIGGGGGMLMDEPVEHFNNPIDESLKSSPVHRASCHSYRPSQDSNCSNCTDWVNQVDELKKELRKSTSVQMELTEENEYLRLKIDELKELLETVQRPPEDTTEHVHHRRSSHDVPRSSYHEITPPRRSITSSAPFHETGPEASVAPGAPRLSRVKRAPSIAERIRLSLDQSTETSHQRKSSHKSITPLIPERPLFDPTFRNHRKSVDHDTFHYQDGNYIDGENIAPFLPDQDDQPDASVSNYSPRKGRRLSSLPPPISRPLGPSTADRRSSIPRHSNSSDGRRNSLDSLGAEGSWRDAQYRPGHWRCSLLADVVTSTHPNTGGTSMKQSNRMSTSSLFISPLLRGGRDFSSLPGGNHTNDILEHGHIQQNVPNDDVQEFLFDDSASRAHAHIDEAPFTPIESFKRKRHSIPSAPSDPIVQAPQEANFAAQDPHITRGESRRSPARLQYKSPARLQYKSPARLQYKSPARLQYKSPARTEIQSPRNPSNVFERLHATPQKTDTWSVKSGSARGPIHSSSNIMGSGQASFGIGGDKGYRGAGISTPSQLLSSRHVPNDHYQIVIGLHGVRATR